jgi:biotin carboxyl carrier protein
MTPLNSPVTGSVWKIQTSVGASVQEGDELMILESMKMEIPVEAEEDGTVTAILVAEGESVADGQALVELE